MTIEDYERLFDAQDGRCAICGTDEPGGKYNVFKVDHDHETGKVRSLLCNGCNWVIGVYKDNPTLLRHAADYVEQHKTSASQDAASPPPPIVSQTIN